MKGTLLHNFVLLIYFLVCVALIAAVLLQTTKSEGLTGTIGGRAESPLLRKKTLEDQLNRVTTFLAVLFLILSTIFVIVGI